MPSRDIHDLYMLMNAAALIKHQAGFESVTRKLLMVSSAPFLDEGRNFGLREEDLPKLGMQDLTGN